MPMHDWTRVGNWVFQDFHSSWLLEIKRALIRGLLPWGCFVMAEQLGVEIAASEVLSFQRILAIRHKSDERILAMIGILSPRMKSSRHAISEYLHKVVSDLQDGIHLLLVDVHPPGPHDPKGIHGAIHNEMHDQDLILKSKRPLCVAAYMAGRPVETFVEHFAVGEPIPSMPLFLTRECYVEVPLEAAYMAAWEDVPPQYQEVLLSSS